MVSVHIPHLPPVWERKPPPVQERLLSPRYGSFPDRPSPPRNLAVTDIKAESCYLTWDAPLDNGGSEITHYVIDKRDASRKKSEWEEVTNTAVERRYGVSASKLMHIHRT